jgi:uncharacterized membrane protein
MADHKFVALNRHTIGSSMTRLDPRARTWLAAVAVAGAVYSAGFVAAPWLEARGLAAGSWLRLAYRPTCHQMPERCLDVGAGPLAVCARCAGLYAGGLAGILLSVVAGIRARPPLWVLVAALLPSGVDFVLALVGLPSLSNRPRFLVATIPGALLGLLLADAVADIVNRIGPDRTPEDPVQ